MLNITLRLEEKTDYKKVEEVTREAFWGFMNPTCDEHYIAHVLRKSKDFISQLSYVAEYEGEIIGNIMYSKAKIVNEEGEESPVTTFAPLSVLPKYQHKGVGKALVKHTLKGAEKLGYRAVLIFGHPDYYSKFGFVNAKKFHITTAEGDSFDAFMALPLKKQGLKEVRGKFYYSKAFEVTKEEVEAFDKHFPYKEPATLTSIEVLLNVLPDKSKEAFTKRNIGTLAFLNRISTKELLTWEGIDEQSLKVINSVLKEEGLVQKT